MSATSSYYDRRRELTGPETLESLSEVQNFYGDGANWTQGVYHAENGAKCLVGAADYVRITSIDDAKYWLRQAIAERAPGLSIEQYNDSSPSFDQVAAVIARAKQLAASVGRAPPRPEPIRALTAEILPRPRQDRHMDLPIVVARAPSASKRSVWRGVRRSLTYFSD